MLENQIRKIKNRLVCYRHMQCVAPRSRRVTQTLHLAFPTHSPSPGQVWSKLDSKEGHFTLEVKRVFRTYLALHYGGLNHTSQMAFP
jgi:hypothetical protein